MRTDHLERGRFLTVRASTHERGLAEVLAVKMAQPSTSALIRTLIQEKAEELKVAEPQLA